ncbi:MAG: hypothetical protein HRU09_01690 [Oligoflexales bacterium]|nr:hypothetical protein [Oligoflexales bacterium]
MAKRRIEDIDPSEEKAPIEPGPEDWFNEPFNHGNDKQQIAVVEQVVKKEISVHYPKAIHISKILIEVSLWSEYNFVMDPSLNRELQIFAPRKMSKDEAFQVFIASLETIGLRALHMEGGIVKIVPMNFGRIAI